MTVTLAHIASATTASFLASLVEAVEALTIVLAVATVRGWRWAGLGALAGLASLILIVSLLGPLLDRVPLHLLQLAIGVLLLLFGMRWLRRRYCAMPASFSCTTKVWPLRPRRRNYASRHAPTRHRSIGSRHWPASRPCCSKDWKWSSS